MNKKNNLIAITNNYTASTRPRLTPAASATNLQKCNENNNNNNNNNLNSEKTIIIIIIIIY